MTHYDFGYDMAAHRRLACRSILREQSDYFVKEPWSPPVTNLHGSVSYYAPTRIEEMRRRTAGIDRSAYFQGILDRILEGCRTDAERVGEICEFVGQAMYYNPVQQPEEPAGDQTSDHSATGIVDAIELLELHDGRCGQGVMATLALLEAAGIEARKVLLDHHVSCEARYDGGWHLADALMFGRAQPNRDGAVLSGEEIRRDPYFTDGFPLPFLYQPLEAYFSEDGFRALGYAFGEWGSAIMPYHSWYWGAPMDHPPTLPYPLVTQRLGGDRVRLNWSPSFKKGGGKVEYRADIFGDRDCAVKVHSATTMVNSLDWTVPEMNRVYYFEVRAMDDHRRFNRDTWYMAVRNSFALVSEDQYGWYGVV